MYRLKYLLTIVIQLQISTFSGNGIKLGYFLERKFAQGEFSYFTRGASLFSVSRKSWPVTITISKIWNILDLVQETFNSTTVDISISKGSHINPVDVAPVVACGGGADLGRVASEVWVVQAYKGDGLVGGRVVDYLPEVLGSLKLLGAAVRRVEVDVPVAVCIVLQLEICVDSSVHIKSVSSPK